MSSFPEADQLVVVIGGADVLRIEPVRCEPFDRAVRDRVRTAFKGVHYFSVALAKHAFTHREHGIVLTLEPLALAVSSRNGLEPVLLYSVTVPGTAIAWITFASPNSTAGCAKAA